jgi:hypothetical protein
MKIHDDDRSGIDGQGVSRRSVLKTVVAGAGLALLPRAHRLLAAGSLPELAPDVSLGYWKHRAAVDLNSTDNVLVDARGMAPEAAAYALRVMGAETDTPLSVSAQYAAGAEHRFWQAWHEGRMLQHSQTTSITWSASAGEPLHLVIRTAGGAGTVEVPAQAGTYVLAIGPDARKVPAWRDLALDQDNHGKTLRLVWRSGGQAVPFPHLYFAVEPIVPL